MAEDNYGVALFIQGENDDLGSGTRSPLCFRDGQMSLEEAESFVQAMLERGEIQITKSVDGGPQQPFKTVALIKNS